MKGQSTQTIMVVMTLSRLMLELNFTGKCALMTGIITCCLFCYRLKNVQPSIIRMFETVIRRTWWADTKSSLMSLLSLLYERREKKGWHVD
ncbi:MAG: hypothetical protein WA364_25625 [Candidatus Nitrosopolaris sp.]